MDPSLTSRPSSRAASRALRVGCVSFINAKPLIEGLGDDGTCDVAFDVPSRLLEDLQAGEVDVALCPVIDFFKSETPLEIVPVGGIGCEGPTLTVRVFSQVPLSKIETVHADTDSHTSVMLMRVLLARKFGLRPKLIDYHAREHVAGHRLVELPGTMLLIGDKVVTDSPAAVRYPHQLDLGEAWNEMTGLPFVFAVWMTRPGTDLGDLPRRLEQQRLANATRIKAITDRYAGPHGWPADLAEEYLGRLLRYGVGGRELEAIERFGAMAHELGLLPDVRPLRLYDER
jgi:chorismate dehydratase